jgi:hypothetical protein
MSPGSFAAVTVVASLALAGGLIALIVFLVH